MRQPILPVPTGPCSIGFFDGAYAYDSTKGRREIAYRCFYPAVKGGTPAMYYEDPQILKLQTEVPTFAPLKFLLMRLYRLQTHSVRNALPAPCEDTYPVLIYSHGYTSFAWSNLIQQEELASHGYVVFCISHPGDAFYSCIGRERVGLDMEKYKRSAQQDELFQKKFGTGKPSELKDEQVAEYLAGTTVLGETVELWMEDTRAAFHEIQALHTDKASLLKGRLDCSRYGLFGHSLGGATSFAMTQTDGERIAGAVNYDGWQYGPSMKAAPAGARCLLLTACQNHLAQSYELDDPNMGCVVVNGSAHLCFCDLYAYCSPVLRLLDRSIRINRVQMAELMNTVTTAFFDEVMRQKNAAVIQAVKRFPMCTKIPDTKTE